MDVNAPTSEQSSELSKLYSELKPIISFFATSSLYGITLAVLLGIFLAGGLVLISL